MLVRHDSGLPAAPRKRDRGRPAIFHPPGPRCGPGPPPPPPPPPFPYTAALASQPTLSSPFLTALVPIVSFPREISAAINSAPADRSLE